MTNKKLEHRVTLKEHVTHARMIYNSSLWQQLPHILAYPLKGHALPLLIISSVVLSMTLNSLIQSILGVFALMTFLSLTLKYAYMVLEMTAFGYAVPPMLTFDMWNSSNQRPLKQLFFLMIIFTIYRWVQNFAGNIPALFMLAFGILLTPASAVIIATENSLFHALNPWKLILLAKRVGMVYLFISLLFNLPVLLMILLFQGFPPLFCITGAIYLLIMTFHLLGFVIYHHRDSLGLTVSFSPEIEAEAEEKEQIKQLGNVLYEVHVLTSGGRIKKAIEELFAKLPDLGDTLDINEKLFARLSLWEEKEIVLAQGQHYISLLIQKKRLSEALKIYQSCFDMSAHFEPKKAFQTLPLATIAYQEKRYSSALQLVQKFSIRCPNHPDNIAIKLLNAKLLGEHFNDYEKAKVIMLQLLELKKHPLYPEIRKYALFLAKYKLLKK